MGIACGARLLLRKGDWSGALKLVERIIPGLIDKAQYRRQRAVLLTARALELEKVDRDVSRESVMEAVKLAPTLIPAATLAAISSESQQTRKAMQMSRRRGWHSHIPILPTPMLMCGWRLRPGAVGAGRALAARTPGTSRARWALPAPRWRRPSFRARAALAPLIEKPTQRVAL